MTDQKLPADPIATIGGILAIVIGVAGCCCYGITAIIPLIIGIVGLVATNRSIRLYNENPEGFNPVSKSNMGMSKVLNIIAIVFNGLIVLSFIVGVLVFGMATSGAVFEGWRNGVFDQENTWEYDEYEDDYNDGYEYGDDETDALEQTIDSVVIDTILIEETVLQQDTLTQ